VNDSALALLEHENLIAATDAATSSAGNQLVRHQGGVALIVSGLPARIFNQIFIESAQAEGAALETAVATAQQRGDRFVVNLRVGADDRFIALTRQLGLVPITETPWLPGMALYPIPLDEPRLPNHEIIRVTRDDQLEDHIGVTIAGFEMPESMVREIITPAMIRRPDVMLFTGYAHGRPVSTGVGVRTGNTIGLYNIATVPGARGKGYGAAISRRVAVEGLKAGCTVAVLQASDMGYPVYQRIGYRTVVEYMGYVMPRPTPAA